MRVAFIVNKFPAISETTIVDMITSLMDRGHEIDIFAAGLWEGPDENPDVAAYGLGDRVALLGDPPANKMRRLLAAPSALLRTAVRDPAMAARSLNFAAYGRQALSLRLLFRARALSGRRPYDVIHAHFGNNAERALSIKRLLPGHPPLLFSFHGYDLSAIPLGDPRYYDELFKEGDLMTGLSRDFAGRLRALGCPADKIRVVKVCLRLSKFPFLPRSPGPGNEVRVLTIARLAEKKGLEYALAAVARACKERPAVSLRYRIVGEGPLRAKLEGLIAELGLANRVELLGWRSHREVPRLVADSHLYLLPSVKAENGDEEGTPVSILEAQASGLPVLSTYHSGIPEIVADGKSALLAPERDVEALSANLVSLIDSPGRWPEMGEAGRRLMESEHSCRKIAADLEAVYRELAERR